MEFEFGSMDYPWSSMELKLTTGNSAPSLAITGPLLAIDQLLLSLRRVSTPPQNTSEHR